LVQQKSEEKFQEEISRRENARIFNHSVWEATSDSSDKILRPGSNSTLTTKDPTLLVEFYFKVMHLKGVLLFTNRDIKKAIISPKNLLVVLKKEYDL
jgi:hypothetical protein